MYRTQVKPVLTTGNIIVRVTIRSFRCPRYHHQLGEWADLILFNGIYDRRFVQTGVVLQACECSLFDTRSILTSFFQVTPALSTILGWKVQIGLLAHHLNREALVPMLIPEVQIDELFVAVQDGQTKGEHTAAFATTLMESQYGAILHIEISREKQTNLAIVEANFKQIEHHTPQKVVGDGCSNYSGAVAQMFPQAQFVRDLVHEVRNVRKQERVKALLKIVTGVYQIQSRPHDNNTFKQSG